MTDWDDWSFLVENALTTEMDLDLEDISVVMPESAFSTRKSREKAAEVSLFETVIPCNVSLQNYRIAFFSVLLQIKCYLLALIVSVLWHYFRYSLNPTECHAFIRSIQQ